MVLRDENAPAHGGKRHQKFDDDIRDYLIECLECNPLLTLRQLNANLQDQFPAKSRISDETSNKIDGLAYTLKLSRDVPADRNSVDTKVWRREYAERYLSPQTVNTMKIYVVEVGCNIHVKRSFAESIRGERAYRPVTTQPGRNVHVTVCAAITAPNGIVHFELYRGGMKKVLFREFSQAVSASIIAENGANHLTYLIFYNAPSHRNMEEALGGTFPIKRLPKYSPFLNPINAFSCWKNDLKTGLAENMHIFLNPDQNGRNGMTLEEFCCNKLKRN